MILVVEDDPQHQLLMRDLLEPHYEVVIAADGQELRAVLDHPPRRIAAVTMDLTLRRSNENGIDLARWVRRRRRWRNLPIVAVTAHAFQEDRERALDAGCDAFVAKPFSISHLLAVLDRVIAPTEAVVQAIGSGTPLPMWLIHADSTIWGPEPPRSKRYRRNLVRPAGLPPAAPHEVKRTKFGTTRPR